MRFVTDHAALLQGLWIPTVTAGRVEADPHGLSFGGEILVLREDIREAFLDPNTGLLPIVHIRPRGLRRTIKIRVMTLEQGRALLRALGVDGSQKTLSTALSEPAAGLQRAWSRFRLLTLLVFVSFFVVSFVGVASNRGQLALTYFVIWLFAMAALGLAALAPTKLTIGGDGLLVRWLGRARYIPYSDIRSVHLMFHDQVGQAAYLAGRGAEGACGVQLWLTSGEVVPLHVRRESDRIHERIAEVVDAWWRRDGALETALVSRGTRDARAWLRALRGIGAKATTGYRTTSMADELWRIVEDVAASAEARAGAAFALRDAWGEEGRARLGRIAAATASPRLRIAIDRAASVEEDEEAFAAALAEVTAKADPKVKTAPSA